MEKQNKTFRVASIYSTWVTDSEDFSTTDYKDAYKFAIEQMQNNKQIVSCLIYSNKNTAIVIQRKYADN